MSYNNREYQYTRISTATTTQVCVGRANLKAIVVNTTAAGSITVIDAVSGSTPVVAVLQASVLPGTFVYENVMTAGIRITTAGASDITVIWAQA